MKKQEHPLETPLYIIAAILTMMLILDCTITLCLMLKTKRYEREIATITEKLTKDFEKGFSNFDKELNDLEKSLKKITQDLMKQTNQR